MKDKAYETASWNSIFSHISIVTQITVLQKMELLSENKILIDLPDSGECSKVTPAMCTKPIFGEC